MTGTRPPGRRRHLWRRDEDGAASLIEMVVATTLSLVLLAMIAKVAYTTERSVTSDRVIYNAQNSALRSLSSAIDHLSAAAPLGVCASPAGQVPINQCQTPSQSGPVIAAAVAASAGSTAPNGLCFYDYATVPTSGGAGAGLSPPTLTCAVYYPDTGDIYVVSYQPFGPTYTNCDPTSCFGNQAPAPGSLPSQPTPTSCTPLNGCSAVLAGIVEGDQAGFGFATASGPTTATSTAAELALISKVTLDAVVSAGSFGQAGSYSYHFTGSVSATSYAEARSWEALNP